MATPTCRHSCGRCLRCHSGWQASAAARAEDALFSVSVVLRSSCILELDFINHPEILVIAHHRGFCRVELPLKVRHERGGPQILGNPVKRTPAILSVKAIEKKAIAAVIIMRGSIKRRIAREIGTRFHSSVFAGRGMSTPPPAITGVIIVPLVLAMILPNKPAGIGGSG